MLYHSQQIFTCTQKNEFRYKIYASKSNAKTNLME